MSPVPVSSGASSRTVRDTAAMLDAVRGPGVGDRVIAPPPGRPYVRELDADAGGVAGGGARPLPGRGSGSSGLRGRAGQSAYTAFTRPFNITGQPPSASAELEQRRASHRRAARRRLRARGPAHQRRRASRTGGHGPTGSPLTKPPSQPGYPARRMPTTRGTGRAQNEMITLKRQGRARPNSAADLRWRRGQASARSPGAWMSNQHSRSLISISIDRSDAAFAFCSGSWRPFA